MLSAQARPQQRHDLFGALAALALRAAEEIGDLGIAAALGVLDVTRHSFADIDQRPGGAS